jgi:hypothetical protein
VDDNLFCHSAALLANGNVFQAGIYLLKFIYDYFNKVAMLALMLVLALLELVCVMDYNKQDFTILQLESLL